MPASAMLDAVPHLSLRSKAGGKSWAKGKVGSLLAVCIAVLIFNAALPSANAQTPAPAEEARNCSKDNTSQACTYVVVPSREALEVKINGEQPSIF